MQIQCDCGKFRAELTQFPKNTPGRLICYCDDCQAFLHYLKRPDLLDENGGTEIIPAYPADIKIVAGKDVVKCVRLHSKGMYRFFTSCCLTPIANTDPVRPWAGINQRMYVTKDPTLLARELGPVKASIMGKYAKGTPPAGTPQTFDFKGMVTVMPFIIKGKFLGKAKHSPFFDNGEAIVEPKVLTAEERSKV
ncbi:MAG: DUF6151 family protein [Bdellovibrionota bacterium]